MEFGLLMSKRMRWQRMRAIPPVISLFERRFLLLLFYFSPFGSGPGCLVFCVCVYVYDCTRSHLKWMMEWRDAVVRQSPASIEMLRRGWRKTARGKSAVTDKRLVEQVSRYLMYSRLLLAFSSFFIIFFLCYWTRLNDKRRAAEWMKRCAQLSYRSVARCKSEE